MHRVTIAFYSSVALFWYAIMRMDEYVDVQNCFGVSLKNLSAGKKGADNNVNEKSLYFAFISTSPLYPPAPQRLHWIKLD